MAPNHASTGVVIMFRERLEWVKLSDARTPRAHDNPLLLVALVTSWALFLGLARATAADPPELVIRAGVDLPPIVRKRIDDAVERAVAFLRKVQNANGSFGDGVPIKRVRLSYPEAYAALPGLALLESGALPAD